MTRVEGVRGTGLNVIKLRKETKMTGKVGVSEKGTPLFFL